ncbi:MAG: hypothetical protein LBS26_05120, partial [Campylobacteraceae bacterium]|jgi:hypothetical protein|nr:hypothetical protein [Campylobacteraceae bacterium]MDR1614930.1 hypothetical protein [Campylobacteraceae bacterium]
LGISFYRIFFLIWSGFILLISTGVILGSALGFLGAKFISGKLSLGFHVDVFLKLHDFNFIIIFFAVLSVILFVSCASSYRCCAADILRKSF